MRYVFFFVLLFSCFGNSLGVNASENTGSAVILSYQQIDEDNYPDTNTQLEQFNTQLQLLLDGGYKVIGLPQFIASTHTGDPLPEKSVIITFDGGYSSIQPALVQLLEKEIPFTLFLAMGGIQRDASAFLNKESVKRMRKFDNVTFGLSAYEHARLNTAAEIRSSINESKAVYKKMFGYEPLYYAYPFGEYNQEYQNILKEAGFDAAVAMHSSPAYQGSDLYALPRYAMSEEFANPDRFELIINTKPLPVSAISPTNPELSTQNPNFGFTLKDANQAKNIRCYVSGQGEVPLTIIENRVEIRLKENLESNRIRLNCTAPADHNDWLWFGRLFTLQQDALPEPQE